MLGEVIGNRRVGGTKSISSQSTETASLPAQVRAKAEKVMERVRLQIGRAHV